MSNAQPLPHSLSCLFRGNEGIWDYGSSPRRVGACPGELMLSPEETGSPR